MSKIVCLIGESGSGKTSLAEEMEREGYKSIQSYTTRPKRHPLETGHRFVSKEMFDKLRDRAVAYTEFNGYEYMATQMQVDESDIYVIDPDGVINLFEKIGRENVFVIYLSTSEKERFNRMVESRSFKSAKARVFNDREKFRNLANIDVDLQLFNETERDHSQCVKTLRRVLESIKNESRK